MKSVRTFVKLEKRWWDLVLPVEIIGRNRKKWYAQANRYAREIEPHVGGGWITSEGCSDCWSSSNHHEIIALLEIVECLLRSEVFGIGLITTDPSPQQLSVY